MQTVPTRQSPVVGAITTLVGRWVSQDAARVNAAQAATRLHHRRRELEDVTRYLAAHQREPKLGAGSPVARDTGPGPWKAPGAP